MHGRDGEWYDRTLGCTQQSTPKACERIKSDGRPNLTKSRGQMKSLLSGAAEAATMRLSSPELAPGNAAPAAIVAAKHRGTVGKWLNVEENLHSGYQSARPAPHCPTPVAQEMLRRAGGSMAGYIGSGSDYPPPACAHKLHPRAMKPEAERLASAHKGGRMEALLYDPMSIPDTRPAPTICVKPEAVDIARKHSGAPVARLLGEYGHLPLSERHARVTQQGEPYAELQKGLRAKQLINEQQAWLSADDHRTAATPSRPQATPSRPQATGSWTPQAEHAAGSSHGDNYDRRNKTTFTMAWT